MFIDRKVIVRSMNIIKVIIEIIKVMSRLRRCCARRHRLRRSLKIPLQFSNSIAKLRRRIRDSNCGQCEREKKVVAPLKLHFFTVYLKDFFCFEDFRSVLGEIIALWLLCLAFLSARASLKVQRTKVGCNHSLSYSYVRLKLLWNAEIY